MGLVSLIDGIKLIVLYKWDTISTYIVRSIIKFIIVEFEFGMNHVCEKNKKKKSIDMLT